MQNQGSQVALIILNTLIMTIIKKCNLFFWPFNKIIFIQVQVFGFTLMFHTDANYCAQTRTHTHTLRHSCTDSSDKHWDRTARTLGRWKKNTDKDLKKKNTCKELATTHWKRLNVCSHGPELQTSPHCPLFSHSTAEPNQGRKNEWREEEKKKTSSSMQIIAQNLGSLAWISGISKMPKSQAFTPKSCCHTRLQMLHINTGGVSHIHGLVCSHLKNRLDSQAATRENKDASNSASIIARL